MDHKSLLSSAPILKQLTDCRKLVIGFSGGLDSTVLLHVLAAKSELHGKLLAVHVNHGISAHAASWQKHCEAFCLTLNIPLITETVVFDRTANIEDRARTARYAVFTSLVTQVNDCLLLGHHQDDQAETVLLQLLRGAGVDGLAAMAEIGNIGMARLVRPFLRHTRASLEQYARMHHLTWIEDESNQDERYTRNYLRQQIIPLLTARWPGAIGNLARTAVHCQEARINLDALAQFDFLMPLNEASLAIEPLRLLEISKISNILRVWIKNNSQKLPGTSTFQRLIHELILARTDAVPEIRWGKVCIRRYQNYLYLLQLTDDTVPEKIKWTTFPKPLFIEAVRINLIAESAEEGVYIPEHAKVEVRFRQGGEDFFWHGQTKSLKKLFQEWKIPPWLRSQIPLIYIDDHLAVVTGYATGDRFLKKNSLRTWLIRAC